MPNVSSDKIVLLYIHTRGMCLFLEQKNKATTVVEVVVGESRRQGDPLQDAIVTTMIPKHVFK